MKIFQAVPNPYINANQYVMTLMDGIDSNHNDVEWGWGVERFWMNDIFDYDIIHIQWPDKLLWCNRTPLQIEKRLLKLKKSGKKIVSTCHNFKPHYCTDINWEKAYNVVYENSDMMIHLGNYSLDVMKDLFPNVKHVLLPHQVYDTVYNSIPDRDVACRKLGLNSKYRYVICFGAFRDDEERLMVKKIANKFKKEGVFFLAPTYKLIVAKSFVGRVLRKWQKIKHHCYNHIIMTGDANDSVPIGLVPYYYAVADIALIQRKKILNSGNLPLAFLMKKVAVGPNVGNVGELQKNIGNPTFDVEDDNSAIEALKNGFRLANDNYGEKNYQYAIENFSTMIISERLYGYYISLLA